MNTGGLFKTMRRMRIVIVLLAMLLAYGAVNYAPRAATSLPAFSVDLGGVTGATNNTVLAFGRYVLVAPFWPSKGVAENGEIDLTLIDNSFLYVIDTKKPNSAPLSKQLSAWDSKLGAAKIIYFPSKVAFDPQSKNVYVRGTRFEEHDGEVTAIDVIAYVHLNLDDNGKPVFDSNVVPIDIQGVSTQYTGDAPLDFAFGSNGDLMVFTNGASVFSYNLDQGYLYSAEIVHPSLYGPDDSISFLDVDPVSNVVSVCENRRSIGKDNIAVVTSEISFYKLGAKGSLDLLKRVFADQLPSGTSLSSGSNIAIVPDGDSEFALFATTDGSLWTVDLQDGPVSTTARRLYNFPELARASESDTTPLLTQYDIEKRVIGVVKPGFTVEISRPSNGKKGRISRPSNLHINSEAPPVLALARLGKKNKVVSASSFSAEFRGEDGLSNFVAGQGSQWLISTYAGSLYSIDVAPDVTESALGLLGQIGSRVNRIEYYSDRSSVVAINSFTLEEDGMLLAAPGSLVVGKISSEDKISAVLQTLLPAAATLGRSAASIRRPCNIKR